MRRDLIAPLLSDVFKTRHVVLTVATTTALSPTEKRIDSEVICGSEGGKLMRRIIIGCLDSVHRRLLGARVTIARLLGTMAIASPYACVTQTDVSSPILLGQW